MVEPRSLRAQDARVDRDRLSATKQLTTITWAVSLSWLHNSYIHDHFCRRAILTCNVGQTGLVFGA